MEFNSLRNTYKEFIYRNYEIIDNQDKIILKYFFEIPGVANFEPSIEILKKDFNIQNVNTEFTKNLVFNLGMIEAISYFKATCSPEFVIECGHLDEAQQKWFRKIFYLGLGEFRFVNKIEVKEEDFITFISKTEKINIEPITRELDGVIIPIGGGKDSNVTLDLLKDENDDNLAFVIGSKTVSMECAKIAGFDNDRIIEVKRVIDKNLIDLNGKGFLNGHTPFSAIVAFITYLCASLIGKKYIALSNEDSANETNVEGENINHQYSKTIEFENDFREYARLYLMQGPEYFSMLRPISELQIAYLFSRLEKYHSVFKSCNVGSKTEPWRWCCDCPKCLFVYTILSPFLYKEKLVNIFSEDLFERENLLNTFIELCGYGPNKPFECVGTYSEIRYAITKTIEKLENNQNDLPYLLKYYKENFELSNEELLSYYNENNNVPEQFEKILKENLK